MKRLFDFLLALALAAAFALPCLLIALLIRLTSPGPALHWSARIGKDNQPFRMPKFRTMYLGTPQLPTHLLTSAGSHITPLGKFLRKTSLDELPQIWSVLNGAMSFVGPRPALFNQHDLIAHRTVLGIDRLRPGITGWAQINGRDEISIEKKVEFDRQYLERQSIAFDLKILAATAFQVARREGIAH